MGQNQTKPVQCGAYQQEQPRESQRDETAIRIRRKLQQGKIKPEQQNFSIQNYQPPQQAQNQMYQQPQMNTQQQQPPFQNQMQQQPSGITPMSQQNRKNIQIKPPKDLMKQENDKRSSLNRGKSAEGRPPKPKSAKTVPQQQPPQSISQPPQQFVQNIQSQPHPQQQHFIQPQPQMQPQPQPIQNQVRQINTFYEIDHENVAKLSQHPFVNCIQTEKGFLQHCEPSLAQLIESRYNTKMYFPEQNVISLFQSIIYAMAAFQVKHIPHHDIYPTNIYFDNNIFKLSNPNFTAMSSYHLTLSRKRFSFLSPQLIICLRQQIQDVKEDLLYRSDMFSFGLVMLQFCSLKPSEECYDQDNYDIIDVVIKRRLAQIKQIYNPKISDGIQMLLKYELGQRMGALEFSRYLNQAVHQYKQDIANAKRSQLNIQGEVQEKPQQGQSTSRVNLITPKNLPNPNSTQQIQPQLQPQPQQIQPPPQFSQPPQQHLPPPQQQIVRQIPRQAPQTLQYEMVQGQQQQISQNQGRPIHSPPPYGYQLPPQQLEQTRSQLQYQYSSELPQRPQPQSKNNSRIQIMQPQVPQMLQTEIQSSPQYHINVQAPPPPSSSPHQNQLPSYPYIQSPISPSTETYAPPAIQRTYISSPPPKHIETSTYVYEPQTSNTKFNDFNGYSSSTTSQNPIASGYIIVDTPSSYNSKYQKQTYTFESSKYSPSTPFNKTLGQLQYNSQTNYYPTTHHMKPQKDIQFSSPSYRQYSTYKQLTPYSNSNRDYNITTQREYSTTKDLYKDKDWTTIKNQINKYNYTSSDSKYTNFANYTSSPSPKFQQQSLQERVRRILQKSKQIK